MTPVHQTKYSSPDGNCCAACVASLLNRKIEDVDIDVASCGNSLRVLLTKIEQRANCKIYYVTHEAILEGVVSTSEKYCFAEVCTYICDNNPFGEGSVWHFVVCEISKSGKLSLVFNPDKNDQRQHSLQQFPVVGKLFFVKANPNN
jgi:hypothetical protein